MQRHVPFVGAVLTLLVASIGLISSAADEKPKFTIKEVMENAHKGPLLKTVLSGKATKEQKEELVIGYTALSLNKPPKGDEKVWKEKTDALIKAAKAVAADDKDKATLAELQKASNCKACHEIFKK